MSLHALSAPFDVGATAGVSHDDHRQKRTRAQLGPRGVLGPALHDPCVRAQVRQGRMRGWQSAPCAHGRDTLLLDHATGLGSGQERGKIERVLAGGRATGVDDGLAVSWTEQVHHAGVIDVAFGVDVHVRTRWLGVPLGARQV